MTLKDLYTNNHNLTEFVSYLNDLIHHYSVDLEDAHYDEIELDDFCDTFRAMGEYNIRHTLAVLYNNQTSDPQDHVQECLYELSAPERIWKELRMQFDPKINSTNHPESTFLEDVCESLDEHLPVALFQYWHKQLSDVFSRWVDSERDALSESRRESAEATRLDAMYRIGYAAELQKQGSNNE